MKTQKAITQFFEDCRQRELAEATINQYNWYLRHFAQEYPELPTTTSKIEKYLQARGETPKHRGEVFRRLQALYSFLERAGIVEKSPVPPKGKMGRPRKFIPISEPGDSSAIAEKVVKGGSVCINLHIFVHSNGSGKVSRIETGSGNK